MLVEHRALQSLRKALPRPVRVLAQALYGLVPPEVHHGPEFVRWRRQIADSEFWPAGRHQRAQGESLAALLRHCFRNVPFYRELARRESLKDSDFLDPGQIRRLPIVGKHLFREQLGSFVAENFSRGSLKYATTGGSTGIPLAFFNSPEVLPREAAFLSRIWEEHGYRPWKDRCAVLRGVFVGDPRESCWSYNPFRKELHLSSYALTEGNAHEYASQVRAWGIRYLQAYPSAVSRWAQYLWQEGSAGGLFKVVFTASENLYAWQRRLIQRVFECPVVDLYGQSEHVAMARQCDRSSSYHFFPQYGIVEFLDAAGAPVTGTGQVAEIVATGFLNWATPMVRYRTGDLVVLENARCRCGREYPLVERIEGRLQELLLTPDGRQVSMTAINMHNDLFDRVHQFQFEQSEIDRVVLRIVPKADYTESDTRRISREVGEKVGRSLDLRIELTDRIEPGPGGKHRFLLQKLPASRQAR